MATRSKSTGAPRGARPAPAARKRISTITREIVSSDSDQAHRWTVMVFMSAQNVPGEAVPLIGEARADIAEMKAVISSARVNILYQLHGEGVHERCHVGKGNVRPVPEDERDNTSGQAVVSFIRWALIEARHEPTDYTLLVLWGHAYRFGFSPEVTRNGIDAMDFEELSQVLRSAQELFRAQYGGDSNPKLNVVGFDACDLATVEMAIQLHEYADYLVASQVGVPLPGWPYKRILERLATPEGRLMGPSEFGSYVVRRYCESYKAPRSGADGTAQERAVSLTLLDLKQAPQLFELTEVLARELALAVDEDDEELSRALDLFVRSQTIAGKPFVDVADLCLNLYRYCDSDDLRNAAERLGNFLISASPVVEGKSAEGIGRPFIVEHGRNALPTARLHGVSLYAPHVALDTHDPAIASHWYEKFVFARQTLWNDLVRALAQPA